MKSSENSHGVDTVGKITHTCRYQTVQFYFLQTMKDRHPVLLVGHPDIKRVQDVFFSNLQGDYLETESGFGSISRDILFQELQAQIEVDGKVNVGDCKELYEELFSDPSINMVQLQHSDQKIIHSPGQIVGCDIHKADTEEYIGKLHCYGYLEDPDDPGKAIMGFGVIYLLESRYTPVKSHYYEFPLTPSIVDGMLTS